VNASIHALSISGVSAKKPIGTICVFIIARFWLRARRSRLSRRTPNPKIHVRVPILSLTL
jgi:hypothetical protein